MISFRHRSNVKRIKIKTHKRLDQRMSFWLQKVFNIKNPIIGFKSIDNKYYDVETFYMVIDKFYNSQVEIVEGSQQNEISFTSQNLNSSSFIRPSQPNTSEINQKASLEEDDVYFVSDIRSFKNKLTDGKDISIFFDIHPGFKKSIVDSVSDFNNPYSGVKTAVYIMLNDNSPKKSNFSIYLGKTSVVLIPLTSQFKEIILNTISRARNMVLNYEQGRSLKPQIEDQAPSFTTHHLQERLNQDACFDYLNRMNKQKMINSYQYQKLIEKAQDNFSDFYKIFCDGVMDNDYQSFKNEIRLKVENNLEMLLSNVEEMDLSRPISREEQRRQNIKKAVPDIEIVKVQNYFQVLDLIKDRLDPKELWEIKQNLLDQTQEICTYFSRFMAREYGKEELSKKLISFARERMQDFRPETRCFPRAAARVKSTDGVRNFNREMERFDAQEEPPMFGSLNIKPVESVVSPIKNMSDIESIYKVAWQKLSKASEYFAPEEYGLLYHYLQTKDDMILNEIQEIDTYEESSLQSLKEFLAEKISLILSENFTEGELAYLESIRNNHTTSYIFENFKYECDIHSFLSSLRQEINKGRYQGERILQKKSSDSQLLEKGAKQKDKRKYSDEDSEERPSGPSPKASQSKFIPIEVSLYQKNSEFEIYNLRSLNNPWMEQFEEMLKFCKYDEPHKEQYLKIAYREGNPSLFLWVRQYLKNLESKTYSANYFRQNVQKREDQTRGLQKIYPIFCELLKQFEKQGKITDKMRKWAVVSFMDCSLPLLGSFEVYLLQKDESQLIDSIKIAFEHDDKEMELYRTFSSRIETLLKQMSIHNEASMQIFKEYPQKLKSFIDVFFFSGNFEDLMQNLDILEKQHIQKSKMNIASLNFSGINTNPFEYDDGSEFFKRINDNVQQLMKQLPDFVDWKLGKIDKEFVNGRLSVGFSSEMESIDNKLLSKDEFFKLWMEKFNKWQETNTLSKKPSQEETQMSITMDFLFYQALIKHVYDASSFEEMNKDYKSYEAHKLNQYLAKMFSKPASKLDIKEDLVIQYLLHQKIDVMCLQEAGCIDWKEQLIPGYSQHINHDSVILYNREKVGNIRHDMMERYGKDLDFNEDSSFIFTDKNYLLLSVHLKAKKQINCVQAKDMFAILKEIKAAHPLLKIVIGMDANHFIQKQNLFNQAEKQVFFMTPDIPDKPTTIKKRSFLQAQYKKAGVAVSEVKDHIATTNKIVEAKIQKVNGEESKDELLPNDIHPYDHFVVRSTIQFL